MKAAIHLEPRHAENLQVHKNSRFEEIQSLFDITKKMILENQEILNVNSIGSENPSWTISALLNDQAIKWTQARVHIYSDSVLCLGRINDPKEAMKRWTGQVAEFQMENSFGELLGLDGEPIEFEWNISQDSQHCRFFTKSTAIWKKQTSNRKSSVIGSSSCPCSTTST